MLGTTLPTPLYPLYQSELKLGPAMITVIFAVYAVGVIAALMLFGRIADQVGRKRVLVPGAICSGASAVLFLVTHGLAPIFAGRLLSGLSAGIFTGTATAMLVELAAQDRKTFATMVAVAVNVGGLGAGTLLSGLLAAFAQRPLRMPYAVDLGLISVAAIGFVAVPETVHASGRFRLQLQRLRVPSNIRGIFMRAVIAGTSAFAVSGLFSAVAPSLLRKLLHQQSPAIAGVLVFTLFALSAVGQIAISRTSARRGLSFGCAILLCGVVLLAASIALANLALLFVSAAACGLGQGLAIGAGLAEINERVSEQRAEITSTYFVLLYAGLIVPVIGTGLVVQATSLPFAGELFCGLVALAVAAVLLSQLRAGSREVAAAANTIAKRRVR